MHLKHIALACLLAVLSNVRCQFTESQEARNSIRRALDKARVQQYTIWRPTTRAERYQSAERIVFAPRGMGPLYNATRVILNSVVGEKAFPEGLLIVKDHDIQVGRDSIENWPSLLQHYAALISIVILGLLLAVVTPIVGFCFCCCRCAGSCGARSQPFDKKHDTCRRVFLGLFLILVATAMLFGVVVAFVTNSYMQEGIDNAPQAARYITDDTALYLNETSNHMAHLLIDNFKQLRDSLMNMLNDSADIVTKELEKESKAISLKQLKIVAVKLPEVQSSFQDMKISTRELRVNASQLNDGLRRVKRELLKSLNDCTRLPSCKQVLQEYQIGSLDTSGIDFSQLPDTTEVINDLEQFVNGDLLIDIESGLEQFDSIKQKFDEAVIKNIGPIDKSINNAGDQIREQSERLMRSLDNIADTTDNEGERFIKIAEDYIKEYSQYRYYAGLVLSGILLLVLVCVSFGLLCGICGKRPDGYGDDCCNKGAGSSFLMCAVAIMFLSTAVLAIVALAHFVVGLLVHRAVCVPLRNPGDDQVFGLFDELVDLDKIIYSRSKSVSTSEDTYALSRIIEDCHCNKSAYEVFKLDHVLNENIDDLLGYVKKFGISEQLSKLLNEFTISNDIIILEESTKRDLEKLQISPLGDFKFYQYTDTLSENITSVNLSKLADKLDQTASEIDNTHDPSYIDVVLNLRNQALVLKTYQANLVTPMVTRSIFMKEVAADLQESLKFNRDNFSEAIRYLTLEIEEAQKFLNKEGPAFVKQMVEEIGGEVEDDIQKYLNYVVNQTKTSVGQCGPMSEVYNSTLVAVCNNVLDPFNGFWAGIGWCILLFIPCIVLSVKLSGLYQKSDPYPGPLVESEYLYDAYADRDNISLTSPPEGKRRNKEHKNERNASHRAEANSQGPSASHDDRYTDMARKQWDDYSEDAPPRYHSPPLPPSEYERPPPYYYPGPTGDRSSSAN